MQEQRQFRRYQVAVTAELEIAGETCVGETRDVSMGGISVLTDRTVEDGRELELALILTQDGVEDPNEDPFEAQARVMWSAPTDDGRSMLGLRFVALVPEQTAQLQRFLTALSTND